MEMITDKIAAHEVELKQIGARAQQLKTQAEKMQAENSQLVKRSIALQGAVNSLRELLPPEEATNGDKA